MKVNQDICVRCGACSGACPFDAIDVTDGRVRSNSRCTECGICEKVCPLGAIKVERKL